MGLWGKGHSTWSWGISMGKGHPDVDLEHPEAQGTSLLQMWGRAGSTSWCGEGT